jgi:hypothetical protein
MVTMKNRMLLAGALALSLAPTAQAGESTTARMERLMSQLEQRSPNTSDAHRKLRTLVRAMTNSVDDDDIDDTDEITRVVTAKSCTVGTALNRDRLESSLASCGTVRYVRVTRNKSGRLVRETVTQNGTNTVYRRQIGTGHKLVVKQRGARNTVAVLQSD